MSFSLNFLDIGLVLAGLIYAIYLYGTWTFAHFATRKVPYLKPVPFLGNLGRSALRKEHMIHNFGRVYNSFPDHRFVGMFQMRIPQLMIRDPELIRQIGVKDFDHFVDHRTFIDEKMDPLFGNNLAALRGQKWRDMRATLSPAFTGSKMRNMYCLVSDCAQQMVKHLKKETTTTGSKNLEMKNLFTVYTNDVIATAAFGLKVDTLENPQNDFYKMGKRITNFSGFKASMKFLGFFTMPELMKVLRIQLIDSASSNFFRELVHDTIQTREQQGIVRHDMINLLMQARQGTLQHETQVTNTKDAGFATVTESDVGKVVTAKRAWTDDDLTAQALIFFLAGFDTAATLLSFAAHELAANPDVQRKLQEEIDEFGEHQVPDYETINRMKYLDMVITETLRMWPPAGIIDRVCVKPCVLEDDEGNKYQVDKDDVIVFPIYHIQHDEKYYDNPEKFDPERFNDENKKNIKPFTYIPFGVGPRNCIGSRFALMEVKAIIFHILSHFDLVPCEKTCLPLTLTTKAFTMTPENGFWLTVVPRPSKL